MSAHYFNHNYYLNSDNASKKVKNSSRYSNNLIDIFFTFFDFNLGLPPGRQQNVTNLIAIVYHSSKIKGLRSTKYSSKALQNLPLYRKTIFNS